MKTNLKLYRNGFLPLLACAAWLACIPSTASANGGGYERGTAYGNILPFEMEEIGQVAMLEEDLQIDLWTDYADVKVAYKMKNTQNRPVKVRFGFPIEDIRVSEDGSVQNYRATARGAELASRRVRQSVKQENEKGGEDKPFRPMSVRATFVHPDDELTGIESWMVSELEFAPGEELELTISCRVPHIEISNSVSDNVDRYKTMVYRLSSAAVWNGPIRKGKVTVRPRSVEADEVAVKTPANRFKREGGAWVWEFSNLEPTLADDISIAVEPDMQERGSTVVTFDSPQEMSLANRVQKRGSLWMRCISEDAWEVTASSEHPALPPSDEGLSRDFKAGNVLWDGTGERRVWGSAGSGIGESITFALLQPRKLAGFRLIPGFRDLDEPKGFETYNSVAEMEVIVNGSWKKTVTFQPGNRNGRWVSLMQCPEEAKTVRLVIRKIHPGTKHDNACLSDVMFFQPLSKEPKINPCR